MHLPELGLEGLGLLLGDCGAVADGRGLEAAGYELGGGQAEEVRA